MQKSHVTTTGLTWLLLRIYLFPIYAILIYTMGLPGYDKIAHADTVMPRYQKMFEPTFINSFPGTPFAIYFLGIIELVAAGAFIISILRLEFLPGREKIFLDYGFFLSVVTFAALGFGLRILAAHNGKHAEPFHLFTYAFLTFLVWQSVRINNPLSLRNKNQT